MTNAKTTAEQRRLPSDYARSLAGKIVSWQMQQKYQGEKLLHAAVRCDFVGHQRFVNAIAEIIDLESAESRCRALADVVRELVEFTNESCRHCGNETCESCLRWQSTVVTKALAVLSEGATGDGK